MFEEMLKGASVWEKLKATKLPIVLYGMGDGADRILDEFQQLHITANEVMASDEFVRGQSFRGFAVKKLSEIEELYDDFLICVSFATQIPEVMDKIKALKQSHRVIMPSVPVCGECFFTRRYVLGHQDELVEAYNILADEESKEVFMNVCYYMFTGELDYLFKIETDKKEALDILNLGEETSYLDLGAYKGDTIEEVLNYTGGKYTHITAVEPDKKNFKKLSANTENMTNIRLENKGIWSSETTLKFSCSGGRGSHIDKENGIETQFTTIDILDKDGNFNYIKIDIEGEEYIALFGATKTIKENKPRLNIACYHRCCDLYRLAITIHKLNPDYKIYMRHHPYIPYWDTNLYCV